MPAYFLEHHQIVFNFKEILGLLKNIIDHIISVYCSSAVDSSFNFYF